MRTTDWVSADSDKASLSVGCGGKTTGWLFVQYLSLKSRALWYTSPWEQTLQNDHRKVSNLWFSFTNSYDILLSGGKKRICFIFRPMSLPLPSLNLSFCEQWHFIVRWDFYPESLILASLKSYIL